MKSKFKIAYLVTRSDAVGGAHIHLLDLALRAQKDGHDVQVWVGGNGLYAGMLRTNGLEVLNFKHLVRPISPLNDVSAVIECIREIKIFSPDILHAHSAKAGLVGRLAARIANVPVVFTAHGWAFTEGIPEYSRMLARFLEKCAAYISDSIICVSEYDRKLALDFGVGDSDLLRRIHNGVVDVPDHLRASPGRVGKVRIVSVARLEAPKNHKFLVGALASLRHLPWELELIGDGPLTDLVKSAVEFHGIEDRVKFSGLCHDVPQRLANSDLSVLISDFEGFPLSILESMRAALPVIASNVGGVSESILDGQTGFLVPKGDKDILVDRLQRLLSDAQLRVEMGRAGRLLYEREFSFEVMYQRTLNVYKHVLGQESARD